MTPRSTDFTTAHLSDTSSIYSDDTSAISPQRCQHSRNRSNVPRVPYDYDIFLNHTTSTTEEAIGSMAPHHDTGANSEERRRRSAAIARAEARLMAWVEADAHTVDRQSEWPRIDFLNDKHQYSESGAVGAVGSRPPTPLRHPLRPSSTITESSENTRGATETKRGAYKIPPFGRLDLGDADDVGPGPQLFHRSPDTPVAGGVRRCIGHLSPIRTTTRELIDIPVEERLEKHNLSVVQNDGYLPDSQASADVVIQHSPAFGSFQPCHIRGPAGAINTMPTLARDQTCSSRGTEYLSPPRSTGGVVSSTGNVYGLGDHILGYSSGHFVTNVSSAQSSRKEPKKSSMRRIFCM